MNASDYFDLEDKTLRYRLARFQHEPLIKACGIKSLTHPTIIDATAGFGQDSLLLAAAGAKVVMVERAFLLQEWLEQMLARLPQVYPELTAQLSLEKGDALSVLPERGPVDIIYLDPMFPERKKSAKVKKRMAFLQDHLEHTDTDDADELLIKALSVAQSRVVVKRPRLASPLHGPKPSFTHSYRSCRFDVYIIPPKK